MKYTLDAGTRSVVGVCDCGARVLSNTRYGALTQLATHHDVAAHPGTNRARQAITNRARQAITLATRRGNA